MRPSSPSFLHQTIFFFQAPPAPALLIHPAMTIFFFQAPPAPALLIHPAMAFGILTCFLRTKTTLPRMIHTSPWLKRREEYHEKLNHYTRSPYNECLALFRKKFESYEGRKEMIDAMKSGRGWELSMKPILDVAVNMLKGISFTYACTTLIWALTENRMMKEAFSVFRMMRKPNVLTYNTILHVYYRCHQTDKTLQMMAHMIKKAVVTDLATYNIMIVVYTSRGRVDEAERVLDRMMKTGSIPNHKTFTPIPIVVYKYFREHRFQQSR